MTETMILIALLSAAAGALLMGIVLEIAEAIWKRQARKERQERAMQKAAQKALEREMTRQEAHRSSIMRELTRRM